MKELDRGVTEEERYWHGWPWALCIAAMTLMMVLGLGHAVNKAWGWLALSIFGFLFWYGCAQSARKKFYLRRRNAQARQEVKF